jgi:hypothetical protein
MVGSLESYSEVGAACLEVVRRDLAAMSFNYLSTDRQA